MNVVTRYAPSPTGFQHIGGLRTALFAFLYAQKTGGDFILRIEDTDKSREVTGAIEHTKEALVWLDIKWTHGPDTPGSFGSCLQSDRLDIYKKYAQKLIDKGLAYSDPYTSAEVEEFRNQAQAEKRPFLFRNHRPESSAPWDGTKPLRFKVPDIKRYHWYDEVRGNLEAGEEMLDDIVIIKTDGYPTYNFAHIVDDYEMGVTHVMRGEEFIASTPKFLSLYDALEIPYPKFVTMPPIMAADGKKKLSKRDGAKDILEYKSEGYLPETMVNFLALIGWNPGTEKELFSMSELISEFSLEKIQKSGGAFNEDKLRWMNKEYLDKLSEADFFDYLAPALEDAEDQLKDKINKLIPTIRERLHVRLDFTQALAAGEYNWLQSLPEYATELLKWKQDDAVTQALPRLQEVTSLLSQADFGTPEAIKAALWDYAEEVGKGQVLWPLRVALSGQDRSPDPFVCAYTLGKEETIIRIKTACDKITGNDQA